MSAHTPGPWAFKEDEYGDWLLVSASGEYFQSSARYYPWVSDNKNDWLLQAAAPELLAVAEYCRDLLMRYEINRVDGEDLSDAALLKLNAAIKKAGGKAA